MTVVTRRIEKTVSLRPALITLFAGLMIFALGGCATGPKTYGVKGAADAIMNRDSSGKSLSVAVRIYQLKDAAEFSKLTFDTVASGRPESELLGPDLLSQSEIIMVPNSNHTNDDKLLDGAKYLGIVGLFRQPDPHYWRFLIEVDKIRSEGLSFKVQDCYLVVLSPKPAAIPGQPSNAAPTCSDASRPTATTPSRTGSSPANGSRTASSSRASAAETSKTTIETIRKQ
jgi:type VI secretion system protein VasD